MNDQIKFSCLSCGQHIECDVTESGRPMLCPSCGANVTVPHLMSELPTTPVPGPDEGPPPVLTPTPGTQRTSGLAIASLVCSLTCVGWLPGVICGHLARYLIRHDPRLKGKDLATAGLIIGYATVILSLGSSFLISTVVKEVNSKRYLLSVTNPPDSLPAAPQTGTNESDLQQQPSPANSAGWTMDVKDATIPSSPVSGEIHGADFQLKRAVFRNGNLRFVSSDGQTFLIIHNLGESVENKSLEFQTGSANGDDAPKIEIAWKDGDENKTETYQDGYAMELKFDSAKGRRIPGQIYLSLPDDSKSYIAGTFTIILPRPKPKPAQ